MVITIARNQKTNMYVAGVFLAERKETFWLEDKDRLALILKVTNKLTGLYTIELEDTEEELPVPPPWAIK